MSDRFDHTLERKLESNADDAADGPSPVRRIELITGTGRRRRWSSAEKARILVESFEPGANVSEVARHNRLSPQQLFAWRREARLLFEEENGTAVTADALPSHRRKARAEPSAEVADEMPRFVPVSSHFAGSNFCHRHCCRACAGRSASLRSALEARRRDTCAATQGGQLWRGCHLHAVNDRGPCHPQGYDMDASLDEFHHPRLIAWRVLRRPLGPFLILDLWDRLGGFPSADQMKRLRWKEQAC